MDRRRRPLDNDIPLFLANKKTMAASVLCCFLVLVFFSASVAAQMPGFVSIDCGGSGNYTDELGLVWTGDAGWVPLRSDGQHLGAIGREAHAVLDGALLPLPLSSSLSRPEEAAAAASTATLWACTLAPATWCVPASCTATSTAATCSRSSTSTWVPLAGPPSSSTTRPPLVTREAVVLASSPTLSVCLSNATTGQPFISTLELRQLNGSLYYTDYEADAFLGLSARINFGAPNTDAVRYPDDPYDRIWESDMVRRANYLVDVSPGTLNVSTDKPVFVSSNERPPQKVMQTAVVGSLGELTYRLDLNGFPGNGWAFSYFAEIQEFVVPETRKFKLYIPGLPDVSKPTVDIAENAPGKYQLYEPGFFNISLPFVLSFAFRKTNDSSKGPILNAFEIYKYIHIDLGSPDAPVMASLTSRYPFADWAKEGGDPCLPSPCRQFKMGICPVPILVPLWYQLVLLLTPYLFALTRNLSGNNLTGNIPPELAALPCLAEIGLANNMLTGPIPDLSSSSNLSIIHFENNQLTGNIPSYLGSLPKLNELYLQNNMLSGAIPKALLSRSIAFDYSGNTYLGIGKQEKKHVIIIISALLGISFLLAAALCCYMLTRKTIRKQHSLENQNDDVTKILSAQKLHNSNRQSCEIATETAHPFKLSDLEVATNNFANRIGSGGFGIVYYGKLDDGKEIAVKVPTNDSYQGKKQFTNEVSLLSRIHHRNLVSFLGYCHQDGRNILVYEFMHNGTLKEHLHGRDKHISWIKRLEIAEDAAKGIEYLHTGCTPSIIHRDIKTSNILLDKQMRAKVSDFGLSKFVAEDSHASTNVRGTLGYLDPQYYISQQLTEKSDIYSFGIILLELISGRPPISTITFGEHFRNIGPWAKFLLREWRHRGDH
ncbi:hypothetical protein PR202_gn00504 [Eleusine coracana subsp. coracana]|uniref:non-specific serine/threonine protein kinase n=1 Tax=Eleusine coracana subsp. coracana TaxID=191504 RepID=A0AAV5G291_ELECO|nr:hypothetical protein PR202_gn00504 [Eleusine coracana subsp. coracana]